MKKLYTPLSRFIFASLLFVQGIVTNSNAQDLPQLNSFMFNQILYNPASGGMYETDFNFHSSGRFQWSGINGAPLTNYSWADLRFSKNSMAAGLIFAYDQLGARQFYDVSANYTYIVRLTNKLKFSVGLRAGYTSWRFNAAGIDRIWDLDDPLLQNKTINYPKFGTGFQLYTKKFYVGIGIPDLAAINNNPNALDYSKNFLQKYRNYTLMGGYRFKISDAITLFPNGKVYYFPTKPLRVDIALIGEVTDYFWIGTSYATNGLMSASVGTHLSSSVRFMYAYEFNLNGNVGSQFNLTTHEVNLMIQLDNLFSGKK